jgi:hypothetical protein
MSNFRKIWLWIKRVLQTGRFSIILADKCDGGILDLECPNPATCFTYHYGQFGHTVVFLFCDSCYAKPHPMHMFGEVREEAIRLSPEQADWCNRRWNKLINK